MEEDATRLSPLARSVDQRSVHAEQAGIASRSQTEDLTLFCVFVTAWQVVIAIRLRVGANREGPSPSTVSRSRIADEIQMMLTESEEVASGRWVMKVRGAPTCGVFSEAWEAASAGRF